MKSLVAGLPTVSVSARTAHAIDNDITIIG